LDISYSETALIGAVFAILPTKCRPNSQVPTTLDGMRQGSITSGNVI
jgi:hypothetical protein